MEFICQKDCFMDGIPDEQVFTKWKEYRVIQKNQRHGYCVMDDENECNWIGRPGDAFFDEYFEENK